jgi:F-type H+-transporting ATPase subunit epsilon
MLLEILTPDKKVYEGEIISVQIPGADGSFQVLKNHAPLVSSLGTGKVKVVEADKSEKFFEVSQGVVEVLQNKIILLSEKV